MLKADNLPPPCAAVTKSENLNFLEPSGPITGLLYLFHTEYSNYNQVPNFMKIHPVGAESFHADGRTDTTKLTVAFRNFANAPKNSHQIPSITTDALIQFGS